MFAYWTCLGALVVPCTWLMGGILPRLSRRPTDRPRLTIGVAAIAIVLSAADFTFIVRWGFIHPSMTAYAMVSDMAIVLALLIARSACKLSPVALLATSWATTVVILLAGSCAHNWMTWGRPFP